MEDEDVGFSLGSLTSALRKVGKGAAWAANPLAQARSLRRAVSPRKRSSQTRVADPTEARAATLAQPGAELGRRFRGARMAPIGFPAFSFVNAGPTTLQASIQPQSAIVIRKLVIAVSRVGATAANQRVSLAQVLCGSDNQLLVVPGAAAGVDVVLFDANVNNNEVSWAPVQVGQLLTIQLAITGVALGIGDSITVAVSMNALTAS